MKKPNARLKKLWRYFGGKTEVPQRLREDWWTLDSIRALYDATGALPCDASELLSDEAQEGISERLITALDAYDEAYSELRDAVDELEEATGLKKPW